MLKQILTGSFILAVFFVNSGTTEANSKATLLLSQTQTVPSTSATPDNANPNPNSDRAIPNRPLSNPALEGSQATPMPDDAVTRPSINNAETSSESRACEDIPLARPTGGATRERLQAIEQCDRTDK